MSGIIRPETALVGDKYQPQHAVDQIVEVMRHKVNCTNGAVIIVNEQTKQAFFGTVQGDLGRTIDMLEKVLASLKRVKAGGKAPGIIKG